MRSQAPYSTHNLPQPSLRQLLNRRTHDDVGAGNDGSGGAGSGFIGAAGGRHVQHGFHRFVEETDDDVAASASSGVDRNGIELGGDDGVGEGGDASAAGGTDEGGIAAQRIRCRDKITAWQAAWNVTNAIQGMFLVSLPYAVLHGGYWSVIFIVFVAFICCYTGRILIACLYEDGIRVRASYREIAEFVFRSRLGGMVVNAAAITEALMTCILYLVLCGDLMLGCFPDGRLSFTAWVSVSFVCLLPCAALTSLRHVSWISFWNTVTHVIINCIIIVYCLTKAAHWQPNKVQFHVDINTFPISVGIIVFSYTSHIFLPTLESNLMDKSRFGVMMNWTHFLSAIFKALFGYIGFVTFAEHTKEVITNNLVSEPLKITVNIALVVKALCSYPLPYFAAANFLESSLFSGWPLPTCWNSTGEFKLWALVPRAALVLFTYIIAITVPHFALLCGLIGSFTGTMLSFVWPAYFHFSLKRHSVSCFVLGLDLLIIGTGLLFGTVGMFVSGRALHRAMSQGYYSPPGNSSSLTPIVAMRS